MAVTAVRENSATIAAGRRRQRGDGTRPVGNTSSRSRIGAPTTRNDQFETHATAVAKGKDPGSVSSAYRTYSSVNPLRMKATPTASMSHPTGLGEVREATRAPTVE
jgi:hypothetical protein